MLGWHCVKRPAAVSRSGAGRGQGHVGRAFGGQGRGVGDDLATSKLPADHGPEVGDLAGQVGRFAVFLPSLSRPRVMCGVEPVPSARVAGVGDGLGDGGLEGEEGRRSPARQADPDGRGCSASGKAPSALEVEQVSRAERGSTPPRPPGRAAARSSVGHRRRGSRGSGGTGSARDPPGAREVGREQALQPPEPGPLGGGDRQGDEGPRGAGHRAGRGPGGERAVERSIRRRRQPPSSVVDLGGGPEVLAVAGDELGSVVYSWCCVPTCSIA